MGCSKNVVADKRKQRERSNKLARELKKLDNSVNYGSKKALRRRGHLHLNVENRFLEC